jgi:hypothetical protein
LNTYIPFLEDKKLSFSGHETFPLRFSWLSKGVQQVMQYNDLFARDDAVVILGVGKNMVTSIQHWTRVLEMVESPIRGNYHVSALGKSLFSEDGWDPYLEDPGTLWLIHWILASRLESSSAWYLAFTVWNSNEFLRSMLEDWLIKVAKQSPATRVTEASMKRDVEVFLRTYLPGGSNRTLMAEDTFDCPLVELGLIEEIDHGLYRFVRGPKSSLPDLIFTYALLDYWFHTKNQQDAVSFENLLHSPGSPGAVFKLSENAFIERLEHLPEWSGLVYDDTSGMRTVFRRSFEVKPYDILRRYYKRGRK